ncbi:MAG: bioH [Gemmatimonadetes bacterium]|nr:bioH [Gemmatimonadota bacterium]
MARQGITWQRVRYPRPEAGGDAGAYRLRPAGAPRGRIVAAHGAGSDALFPLLGIFAPLVHAGFEVFAFDADGSGWDCTTRLDPAAARSSTAAALARAMRGEPELPTHLLGYSLGGTLLLDTIASPPPYVRSAILLSAPLRVCFGVRSSIAEMLGFLTVHTLREIRRYGPWGVLPAAGGLKRRAFPYRLSAAHTGAFGYVDAVQETLRAADPERAAARAQVPVLLVYGEGDALVPPSQGERLAELIPRSTLVRLPRASHWTVPIHPRTARAALDWIVAHTDAGTRPVSSRDPLIHRSPSTETTAPIDSRASTASGGSPEPTDAAEPVDAVDARRDARR